MKLATYTASGIQKVGLVTSDLNGIIDLAAAANGRDDGAFSSMLALIEGGESKLDLAREVAQHAERSRTHQQPLADVKLLAPLPVPPQIRDFSSFPMHLLQSPVGMQKLTAQMKGQPIPDLQANSDVPLVYRQQPIYYISNRFSVIGPDERVHWPRYSTYMDFELELAAVLWKRGKDIHRDKAADYIFGYTIFNDFSARDAQVVEMQGMLGPAKGKSFDMGNAMGPWIVTRDEIPDVKKLIASARVNGETFVKDDCAAMLHSFEDMIAFVSRDETLHPGEVFGSGTVGNGSGLERFRFLQDGDVIELEFDRIGALRNTVVRQDS